MSSLSFIMASHTFRICVACWCFRTVVAKVSSCARPALFSSGSWTISARVKRRRFCGGGTFDLREYIVEVCETRRDLGGRRNSTKVGAERAAETIVGGIPRLHPPAHHFWDKPSHTMQPK